MSQAEIAPSPLPPTFLTTASPNIAVSRVDFTPLFPPAYRDRYAVILDNVLSPSECATFLRAAEATAPETGWERALVNIGGGQQKLITDARNCGRIIWDSQEVVGKVWYRIKDIPEVQEISRLENMPKVTGQGPFKRREVWRFTRPNERMRFLKYVGGEYFRPHCDGVYETPDGTERSYYTLHLYLNDAGVVTQDEVKDMTEKERAEEVRQVLVGGATTFFAYDLDRRIDVMPKAGRVLLFQHRDLIHSGEDVVQGVKYTMRTDLMYTLDDEKAREPEEAPVAAVAATKGAPGGAVGKAATKAYGYISGKFK